MPRAIVEAGLSDEEVPRINGIGDHRTDMNAKVLIVDDSALTRRSLRQILENRRLQVVEAENGLDALERYFLGQAGRGDARPGDARNFYGLELLAENPRT